MLDWKNSSQGKTALMIQGSRRVGKSFAVEQFAKSHYDNYILVDFSKPKTGVLDTFENDLYDDLDNFFAKLCFIYKTELKPRKSLIIFDEVQLYPKARQAIKSLVADGRYDYIETGSLVSIQKNVKDILIPSEEESIEMNPMDFEEFLWAKNDLTTIPFLKQHFLEKKPLGELHKKALRDFYQYMLIGGMPQAIDEFLSTNSYLECDATKRRILELYSNDIMKFSESNAMAKKIQEIYKRIPSQLEKHVSYSLNEVIKDGRATTINAELEWLEESKIANFCYRSSDPNVGLALSIDINKFKIYNSDTGLLTTQIYSDSKTTGEDIYNKLLFGTLGTNDGYLLENIVAQTFKANGYALYYTTFRKKEESTHVYEMDFILTKGKKIVPIEVKSSNSTHHESFDSFCQKYSSRIGEKYIIHTGDLRKDKDMVFLPVYMTMFI